ncbi:MAG TPA: VOC family protein [Candidatus Baltobacteraceae bacterium]
MSNSFVHLELSSTDVAKAKSFYAQLFSWELKDMPEMAYTMVSTGGDIGGGMMQSPVPGAPSMWLTYVAVDDVAAATKKAVALGATVCKDITEVPGMGSFTIIADPTGATLGLWQSTS